MFHTFLDLAIGLEHHFSIQTQERDLYPIHMLYLLLPGHKPWSSTEDEIRETPTT